MFLRIDHTGDIKIFGPRAEALYQAAVKDAGELNLPPLLDNAADSARELDEWMTELFTTTTCPAMDGPMAVIAHLAAVLATVQERIGLIAELPK